MRALLQDEEHVVNHRARQAVLGGLVDVDRLPNVRGHEVLLQLHIVHQDLLLLLAQVARPEHGHRRRRKDVVRCAMRSAHLREHEARVLLHALTKHEHLVKEAFDLARVDGVAVRCSRCAVRPRSPRQCWQAPVLHKSLQHVRAADVAFLLQLLHESLGRCCSKVLPDHRGVGLRLYRYNAQQVGESLHERDGRRRTIQRRR
mmetsp:Transcript_11397/g.47746  ORF Transcript_11397/g.47746 Transcript_11397/m.47746 type:complete len:202 (-) Transcript_11397:134-739(-)